MCQLTHNQWVNNLPGGLLVKRSKMGHRQASKLFTRTAKSVHPKNSSPPPMRGGIRL